MCKMNGKEPNGPKLRRSMPCQTRPFWGWSLHDCEPSEPLYLLLML